MTELSAVPASVEWGDDDETIDPSAFIVDCPTCATHHVVRLSSVESTHRTSEGMVGYVRCGFGHLMLTKLVDAYPTPPPPASVIELRERLIAAAQEPPMADDPRTAERATGTQ